MARQVDQARKPGKSEDKKSFIFVTVGNGRFDPLLQEIDRLKEEKMIANELILQIGHGTYEPKHGRWFRFEPSLEKYYETAELIISHGGPGTVFEVLRRGKKLIALPNRDRTDPQHQVEFLQALAKETAALLYCGSPSELSACLKKATIHPFTMYQPPACTIHKKIQEFLHL